MKDSQFVVVLFLYRTLQSQKSISKHKNRKIHDGMILQTPIEQLLTSGDSQTLCTCLYEPTPLLYLMYFDEYKTFNYQKRR